MSQQKRKTGTEVAAGRKGRWLIKCAYFVLIVAFAITSAPARAQIPAHSSNPSARATVYLDFDGQNVQGTAWNWEGAILAKHCGLNDQNITEIFNRVSEDFRIFNLNITTDVDVYLKAPTAKRVRVIVTPTYQWYGHAGGVAFVNSFSWGDDTPAWVFTSLLDNNTKYIAEATSHEIGHTLGLQHQSTYNRACELVSEYAEGRGDGEIGWAPIMGVGYYKNFTTWTYGSSIEGCKTIQNDLAVISKGLNHIGLRADDHGDSRSAATTLAIANSTFQTAALINHSADKDVFRIQLVRKSRLSALVIPHNIGSKNEGANIDMQVTLFKSSGAVLLSANPKFQLSASIDTLLPAGTYYIEVDGVNNQNVSDYGSLGMFSLTGTVTSTTTSPPIVIKGSVKEKLHLLSWNVEERESINKSYLEYSYNGQHYLPLDQFPVSTNQFTNKPVVSGNVYYRLKVVLPDETSFYSNSVLLSNGSVTMVNTLVRSQVQVNAAGDYQYQVFDETGRLYGTGRLKTGINTVDVAQAKQGVLVMKVFNRHENLTFKLIKQ